LRDKRDAFTKHYLLDSGKLVGKIYLSPIHFINENGEYQEIDNTLIETPDGAGYTNLANSFKVYFPKVIGGKDSVATEHKSKKFPSPQKESPTKQPRSQA